MIEFFRQQVVRKDFRTNHAPRKSMRIQRTGTSKNFGRFIAHPLDNSTYWLHLPLVVIPITGAYVCDESHGTLRAKPRVAHILIAAAQ